MNVGGPAVEIAELMRGLDPGGFSQRLVTGYCSDDEADFLETQATDLTATRVDGLGRRVSPMDDAQVLNRLTRIIRASRPDIIHTHTAKAGVLGRVAAKMSGTGVKIIHTHHGHLLFGYFGPVKTRAVVELERRLSRVTDHSVAVGDSVREDLLRAGIGLPDQFTVIRSGVKLNERIDKQTARRQLGIPDGPVVVSMIGRLTRIKRPDRFADAVKIIQQRGLDAVFLVAGGGDQEDMLRVRVDREQLPVIILGWRTDVERLLSATDIMLQTSDNEGVPLSLIQGSTFSIPAVATSVGAVAEVVQHEVTGLLTDLSSVGIATALETLIEDQALRAKFGLSAGRSIQGKFSLQGFLRGHASLYSATMRR